MANGLTPSFAKLERVLSTRGCVVGLRDVFSELCLVVSNWIPVNTTSFQEGLPAELKHINKRRKRKQKRFPE